MLFTPVYCQCTESNPAINRVSECWLRLSSGERNVLETQTGVQTHTKRAQNHGEVSHL